MTRLAVFFGGGCSTRCNSPRRDAFTTLSLQLIDLFISPPEKDSFRKDFSFAVVSFFFSPRNLRAPSADRREILHDAPMYVQFHNPGPKFLLSLSKKKFKGRKHAKFGPISVDFKVWRPISPERIKIFKIGELLVRHRFLPREAKQVR